MKYTTAKTEKWQSVGGIMDIPDGWFVTEVNLDVEEPYAIITADYKISNNIQESRMLIPKSLAYYLSTHFCGSNVMRQMIQENTKHSIGQSIKEILGL